MTEKELLEKLNLSSLGNIKDLSVREIEEKLAQIKEQTPQLRSVLSKIDASKLKNLLGSLSGEELQEIVKKYIKK